MKNIKGFTLIELLAVLTILAVILLITIPTVTDLVVDSKSGSEKINAQNYIDAVNLALAEQKALNVKNKYNGIYEIVDEGKYIQKDDSKIKIDYKGKGLESGRLIIKNGIVEKLYKGKIDDYIITYYNDKLIINELKGESTLVKGSEFNAKIKTLVKGSSVSYSETDSIITNMYILSNGNLPEGYTKEELEALENVSLSSDNKVKAYYDSSKTTVYVYSENQIYANEDSSGMFSYFSSLIELDVTQLDTSKVTNMESMFDYCCSLPTLDLSNFDTSKVTNMHGIFANCYRLTSLDLSSFDTSKVTVMSIMFMSGNDLTEIIVSDKWVINSGTDTEDMFYGCGTDHVTVK